jgi:signal transduction histidine kinase
MEESAPTRHRAAIAVLSERALHDDFGLLLTRVAEAASYALDAGFCAVLELAPDGASMRTRAAYGAGSTATAEIKAGSAFGRLLMAGGEIALTDPYVAGRVPRWLLERGMMYGISHRIDGARGDFGALCAFRAGPRQFDAGDLEFLRAAANLAALAARLDRGAPARREIGRDKPRSPELIAGFLANTSHEIRNPLHVILGYNEIIADHVRESGGSLAPFVAAVERAGQRLLRTVERLLAYSRLESGAVEAKPGDTALAPLIEAIVREFEPRAAAKGIMFSAGVEEPAMAARCDPDHLAIALDNLADNAIKFTERGEIAIRLYRGPAGEPAIRIRDTGVGIDPAYLPHLFEPFSQEQSSYSRRFEGSGLGLTLARRYLELNGAAITVESKKGAGSTFTVHLLP